MIFLGGGYRLSILVSFNSHLGSSGKGVSVEGSPMSDELVVALKDEPVHKSASSIALRLLLCFCLSSCPDFSTDEK